LKYLTRKTNWSILSGYQRNGELFLSSIFYLSLVVPKARFVDSYAVSLYEEETK